MYEADHSIPIAQVNLQGFITGHEQFDTQGQCAGKKIQKTNLSRV